MISSIILIGVYIFFTVSGLICYKYGTSVNFQFSMKDSNLSLNINIVALIGLLLYIVSFLLYIFVIPKFNLTYILPIISAIVSVLVYILSIVILKEEVTARKIVGALIIIIGVLIMGINGK